MTAHRIIILTALVFLLLATPPLPCSASDNGTAEKNAPSSAAKPPSTADIEKTIAELKKRAEAHDLRQSEALAAELDIKLSDLSEMGDRYRALIKGHEKHLGALKKSEELAREIQLLTEKLEVHQQKGMYRKPPYPLSFHDGLLGEIDASRRHQLALADKVRSIRKAVETLAEGKKELLRALRNLKAQAPEGDNGAMPPGFQWRIGLGELGLSLNAVQLSAETLSLANTQKEQTLTDLKMQLLTLQVAWVKKHLKFDESDLAHQHDAIDKKEAALQQKIDRLKTLTAKNDGALAKAREKIRQAVYQSDIIEQEAFLKLYEAQRKGWMEALEQTGTMIGLLGNHRQVWLLRYELLRKKADQAKINRWLKASEERTRRQDGLIPVQQERLNDLLRQIDAIEKTITEEKPVGRVLKASRQTVSALRERFDNGMAFIGAILSSQRLEKLLREELDHVTGQAPIRNRLVEARRRVGVVWEHEIWVIDENPVTVRKLTVALLLLVAGITTAKFLLRNLAQRLTGRTQIRATTASTIQKLLLYFSYFMVSLFALRIVNIPLAAFAFLGGAVAIGLGFGAQNLINNFISGFIVMGERPISIGDLIEVEGVLGKVQEIGARSTRIRTGENIHILVPNSSFLEKNITNWTLSDNRIRTHVTVGVAYGSPVRTVETLLLDSARGCAQVLGAPNPFVTFDDFGDNALVFRLYFWIGIRNVIERKIIESQVRYRIDDLFRGAGITIAFPQRDLHLDTDRPISLRLIRDAEKDGPARDET